MKTNNPSEGLVSLLRASGLGGGDSLDTQMTSIADQLQQLKAINDVLTQQTIAAMTQPAASGSSGGSTGDSMLGTIGSTLGGVVSGGLGLAPLISGLAGLFGGRK